MLKKLKYLKEDKILELMTNLESNKNLYLSKTSLVEKEDYIESRIMYEDFDLELKEQGNNKDIENSIIVYKSLKNLKLIEASDERIWVGLTHDMKYQDYILGRWEMKEDTTINSMKSRFFNNPKRNSLSRLWWYGYLSYSEKYEDPFTLTRILAGNHDLAEGLLGRNFGRNKDFILMFLETLYNWELSGNGKPSNLELRKVLKGINRMSGITVIDLIEKDEIENLLKKYCNKK